MTAAQLLKLNAIAAELHRVRLHLSTVTASAAEHLSEAYGVAPETAAACRRILIDDLTLQIDQLQVEFEAA